MQDLKEVKQLCQAHVAGEIDLETYRDKRSQILALLVSNSTPPVKRSADNTIPSSTSAYVMASNDQEKPGILSNCSGMKLMICSLIGITVIVGLGYFGYTQFLK